MLVLVPAALSIAAPAPLISGGAAASAHGAAASGEAVPVVGHTLLSSRELWATIDVCGPADQPDTVGVRGSMPGESRERDAMYMRFRLQYEQSAGQSASDTWVDLAHGADSGFIEVGTGKAARQGGASFQLVPPKSGPGYMLRGVVTFQWRHDGQVAHEATRTTSAGHESLAGSDPAGYSAAGCTIP
jgi:hypothetical protein